MKTWAILPLRSLHDSKRRLRDAATPAERTALVQRLFRQTLNVIVQSWVVHGVCVVSPDIALLAWVRRFDVLPIMQSRAGLNAGLDQARQILIEQHDPDALLVVLPDLPLLTADDIARMHNLSVPNSVVLAPDRHEQGTNALLVRPAGALPFCFGPDSLRLHHTAAVQRHIQVLRYDAPGTAFDVDTPDDLRAWNEIMQLGDTRINHAFDVSVSPCLRGE